MTNNSLLTTITAIMIFLTTSCGTHNHKEAQQESGNHKASDAQQAHPDDEIILEPELAQKYGVMTATVQPSEFMASLRITGQLLTSPSEEALVTATTTGTVTLGKSMIIGTAVTAGQRLATIKARTATGDNPNAASTAAIASAKRELERLKPLLDDGIATMAEYNAALAAYEAAKASYSPASASGAVSAPISGSITQLLATSGQFVETGTPLAKITRNSQLILRADLPESEQSKAASYNRAAIKLPSSDEWLQLSAAGGKRLDNADLPTLAGYYPLFFIFNNSHGLTSGTFVDVELESNTPKRAILIPATALTEQQGTHYVFVKVDAHGYEQRPVTVGSRKGSEVEITSGLTDGESIVTAGVSALKMARSSGNVPEGHSHNH